MTAQALLGQTYTSHTDLWASLDERREVLNHHLPSRALSHKPPLAAVQRLVETRMFSIHRLVQAVQMDSMERGTQRQWAERVVRAVNSVFPNGAEPETWPQCLLYLSQAQACVSLIERYALVEPEAAALLETARYLSTCALDTQALPLFQQSLPIGERDADKMIDTLIDLGSVYSASRYGRASHGVL
jgi:hypothetical protein